MNERQKEKTLKRLYGRNPAFEILLSVTLVIMLFFLFFILCLSTTLHIEDTGSILAILILLFCAECAYILSLLTGQVKHSKQLKEKYNELPHYQQEELLRLAQPYKRKHGTRFNEHYIYGMMTESRKHSKLPYVNTFLYVDLSQITWIYLKTESIMTWSPQGSIGSNVVRSPQGDLIVLHTHDGKRYKAGALYTNTDALFSMIRQKNPSCKLGYKKEWEALYK